jgi:glutamate--cysteine ligase
VIEVRGADAVPAGLTCSLPALWKGLLYDAQACAAAFRLAEGWDRATREAALRAVAARGLAAEAAGRPVLDLARELVGIASEGLRRTAPAGSHADERGFLDPILAQLEEGKSPGQVVLERWEGEWGRSLQRLIEYARY